MQLKPIEKCESVAFSIVVNLPKKAKKKLKTVITTPLSPCFLTNLLSTIHYSFLVSCCKDMYFLRRVNVKY